MNTLLKYRYNNVINPDLYKHFMDSKLLTIVRIKYNTESHYFGYIGDQRDIMSNFQNWKSNYDLKSVYHKYKLSFIISDKNNKIINLTLIKKLSLINRVWYATRYKYTKSNYPVDELLAIKYNYNIIVTKPPDIELITNYNSTNKSNYNKINSSRDKSYIHYLDNKKNNYSYRKYYNNIPEWSEKVGSYTLKFSMDNLVESVKNMQILDNNSDNIIFEFGKSSTNVFILSFKKPLSMIEAFTIGLTTITNH